MPQGACSSNTAPSTAMTAVLFGQLGELTTLLQGPFEPERPSRIPNLLVREALLYRGRYESSFGAM